MLDSSGSAGCRLTGLLIRMSGSDLLILSFMPLDAAKKNILHSNASPPPEHRDIMGSSTSKAAKTAAATATRKYPSRVPPPRQQQAPSAAAPGSKVHPEPYASSTRDEGRNDFDGTKLATLKFYKR